MREEILKEQTEIAKTTALTFEGAEYNFHGAATPLYFSPTSLFCINDKNPIRRAVVLLITWKWFDRVVTIVIMNVK